MDRIIFHIDVNSAFLSWSAVNNLIVDPGCMDLRSIPSIIGGNRESRHGIVLAKSVPAKTYQIQTGEPIAQALRKCPTLMIEPPNHELYKEYSKKLFDLLAEYSPDIEQLSIDEGFLDFTPIAHQYSSSVIAATMIKNRIYEELGFTVNIGIAPNKLLAKMASDFKKPNLVHTLFLNEIKDKMWPMPVGELYMAGKASVKTLNMLGIHTIGDLAATSPKLITLHLKSHGQLLWQYANGIDDSPVMPSQVNLKGIGNSITLSFDAVTSEEINHVLLGLAEQVSKRLRLSNQLAGMISVEIKYNDFSTVSHQMQLTTPANTTEQLYHASCILISELWNHNPVRLLGVRTSKLVHEDEPVQMTLFDTVVSEKQLKAEKAMDLIKNKYGNSAIVRGSFLNTPSGKE
ncbi:Y-family DNA polymerase [Lachnotalea glycerini]|uniref:DNA polymerase IV n=1 Tax=Lachnotalea glycerini TaxID=1763509 RepID=A0A371JEQ6_9FIRM|nr:DNA polymerase IV [Lachnotalea glycerini]RDY31222.1 DNA polymerase IV [Lachnotalea glycerini]